MRLIIESDSDIKELLENFQGQFNLSFKPPIENKMIDLLFQSNPSLDYGILQAINESYDIVEVDDVNNINELIESFYNIDSIKTIHKDVEIQFETTHLGGYSASPENYARHDINRVMELIGFDAELLGKEELNNGSPTIVAVVDSGVDYYNNNIKNSLWMNEAQTGYGFNLSRGNEGDILNVFDDWSSGIHRGHGTHITGLISGSLKVNETLGVFPMAKVLTIKILPSRKTYFSDACLAMVLAVLHGASVINCSWTFPENSINDNLKLLMDKTLNFLKKKNCIPVFSAMNLGSNVDDYYPQNISEIITVGATNYESGKADFSNWGSKVDFWAPGKDIWSLTPKETRLIQKSGTSMSAPFVSATIAMLKKMKSDLDLEQIREILIESGTKIDMQWPDGKARVIRLNISGAINYLENNYL
ncbi:S8 family serine peptidase [Aureisphaera galaxeae]|uniref:S8 family peptidase n=1 Tax=Aureisphaera galaxeae TaxID=1538023 RepID=UPI0023506A4E|nr:S8 family serine peptidase [Aureisphaera galaxeae]MDC8003012.1 S8 family serine peptidase [Aureisphaera galaxeae]